MATFWSEFLQIFFKFLRSQGLDSYCLNKEGFLLALDQLLDPQDLERHFKGLPPVIVKAKQEIYEVDVTFFALKTF